MPLWMGERGFDKQHGEILQRETLLMLHFDKREDQ